MPGKGCGKGGHRKHTEITSERQRGFFGAELERLRSGKKRRSKMSEAVLSRHLEEAGGKSLPERVKRTRREQRVARRRARRRNGRTRRQHR